MLFEWREDLAVHVGTIDEQHRTLFQLAERLHQAMRQGQGQQQLAVMLDDLIRYTRMHFAHEEELMRVHHYPQLVAHRAEHGQLTADVQAFRERFSTGELAITVDLMKFLQDWLSHHIGGSDAAFAAHLQSNGLH